MLKRSQSSQSLFVVEAKVDVVGQRPAVDVGSRLKWLFLKARRCAGHQNHAPGKSAAHCADHFGSTMASGQREKAEGRKRERRRKKTEEGRGEGEERGKEGEGVFLLMYSMVESIYLLCLAVSI